MYLYAKSLRRFNQEVKLLDLTSAYLRARLSFGRRMCQTFAVLGESGPGVDLFEGTGSNQEPIGQNRNLDGAEGVDTQKKKRM